MKATEQYFAVVLFIMLYKVVLTFEQTISKGPHNENAASIRLLSLWMKSQSATIQMKATEQYFPAVLFLMLFKVIVPFESVFSIYKRERRPKTDAIRQCFTE